MMLKEELIKLFRLHGLKSWKEEKKYTFPKEFDFTLYYKIEKDLDYTISENLELSGIKNDIKILKNNEITFSFRILSEEYLNNGYIKISKKNSIIKNPLQIKFEFSEYNIISELVNSGGSHKQ